MSGISPFTQAGFELAKTGLWKPRDHTLPPIVYALNLLGYRAPFFDIEMFVINEKEMHLKEVILDIGLRLRTSTLSESIRRTSIGPLKSDHSLVIDEISPDRVISHIQQIEQLVDQSNLFARTVVVNRSEREEQGVLAQESPIDADTRKQRPSPPPSLD